MKHSFYLLIGILFLISVTQSALASNDSNLFLSVILNYDQGKISFQDVKLIQSTEPISKEEKIGNYTLKVYSFKQDKLYETKVTFDLMLFNEPPKEWFDEEGNQIYFPNETYKPKLIIDKTSKVVFVPYFKTINFIKLFNSDDVEIASKDVSELAVCNQNSICDNNETKELCPEDCKPLTYPRRVPLLYILILFVIAIGSVMSIFLIKKYKTTVSKKLNK